MEQPRNEIQATRPRESIAPWLTRGALRDGAHSLTALSLRNRAWYPFILFTFFTAAVVTWFRFPPIRRPELLIPTVGRFLYFLYQQHLNETKLFKELFVDFNHRYDELNDDLNAILFDPSEGVLRPDQREKVFNYSNLPAEEYFFYKAGYIDHDVWRSWSQGMNLFFGHPRIQGLWEQERKESYYGFQPPK